MAPRSNSILRPPIKDRKRTPTAEAICGYMKALDEECKRILIEEGILTNDENLNQIILKRLAKGALQ